MSRDGWTEKEHVDYDEWCEHFATYQKWLTSKPQDHQLFNMSVKNIKRQGSLAYFRGYVDAIAHLVAVVQQTVEKCKTTEKDDAKQTLAEYGRLLLGCTVEKIQSNHSQTISVENTENVQLFEIVSNVLPLDKEKEFYVGYKDGYEQMNRIVAKIYSDQKTFPKPFEVLKSIFYIQSGFCVGVMIENWPKNMIPKKKTT